MSFIIRLRRDRATKVSTFNIGTGLPLRGHGHGDQFYAALTRARGGPTGGGESKPISVRKASSLKLGTSLAAVLTTELEKDPQERRAELT